MPAVTLTAVLVGTAPAIAGLLLGAGGGGADGKERPNVKEMAFLQAVGNREREILQEMDKHFKSVKEDMEGLFKKMDSDGSGFLSKEEVQKMCQENEQKWGKVEEEIFAKMDVDKDGKVSLEGILLNYHTAHSLKMITQFLASNLCLQNCEKCDDFLIFDNTALGLKIVKTIFSFG